MAGLREKQTLTFTTIQITKCISRCSKPIYLRHCENNFEVPIPHIHVWNTESDFPNWVTKTESIPFYKPGDRGRALQQYLGSENQSAIHTNILQHSITCKGVGPIWLRNPRFWPCIMQFSVYHFLSSYFYSTWMLYIYNTLWYMKSLG